MQPLQAEQIRGAWATLLLPINPDERIDDARLAAEVDYLVRSGVNGLYSNGTAGEFWAQTEDEFDRICVLLAERCDRAGVPFQIGASHPSPQISLERVRRASRLVPGAIQVILPDWVAPTTAEAMVCLERFAAAADPVGLVLYNPPHAKRVLTPTDFAALKAAVPSLVGIKVAGGDDAWYAQMRAAAAGLSVFIPGHCLATAWQRGAAGSYSNVACLSPQGARRWFEIIQQDPHTGLDIERRIAAFMRDHILPFKMAGGYADVALDKLLGAIGGWADIGTRVRWPYRWIPQDEADRLRPIAQRLIPELF